MQHRSATMILSIEKRSKKRRKKRRKEGEREGKGILPCRLTIHLPNFCKSSIHTCPLSNLDSEAFRLNRIIDTITITIRYIHFPHTYILLLQPFDSITPLQSTTNLHITVSYTKEHEIYLPTYQRTSHQKSEFSHNCVFFCFNF